MPGAPQVPDPPWRFGDSLPLHLERSTWPDAPPPRPKVAVYGDSYAGNELGRSPAGWPALLADALGVETVNQAVSGSGYVKVGHGATWPYLATIAPVPDAAAVVVMGSQNDRAQDPTAIHLGMVVTLAAITRGCPHARVLVVGPYWPWDDEPSAGAVAARDAVRDTAAEHGLAFLDPLAEQWLGSAPGLIGSDGAHPSPAGHAVIAGRLAPHLAALLS